jgi:NAD(P)-dependent dehydrogenase (short-subunit alcohol dehydrogenase family)
MKNIVITGGNRGIGLGLLNNLSKDHNVIITSRTEEKGLNAIRSIVHPPKKVDFVIMDVNKSESVIKGFAKIKEKFKHIDVLFNNAGILIPGLKFNISAVDTDEESILKTFNTNTLTKVMANELSERNISVNAICPGWVQTDMGGKDANLTINESVSKIISFALGHEFPTGKFLRHGEIIPW